MDGVMPSAQCDYLGSEEVTEELQKKQNMSISSAI